MKPAYTIYIILLGVLIFVNIQILITLRDIRDDRTIRTTSVHHHVHQYDIKSYGEVILPKEDNFSYVKNGGNK